MIHILYFASVREQLDCSEEELEATEDIRNIAKLMDTLSARGERWKTVFSDNRQQLLFSINQNIARESGHIDDGDEIAFFPQVTGG